MTSKRLGLILAVLILSACAHHKPSTTGPAPLPQGDSELTGIPPQPLDSTLKTPPRATLVALPNAVSSLPPPAAPQPQSEPIAPAPVTIVSATPPAAAPVTAPPAVSDAEPAPPVRPDSGPALATPGASAANTPAPPDNDSDAAHLALNAPVPPAGSNGTQAPEDNQVVVLQTSMGKMVIELDDFAAPKTCKNFRELIADGFYNNTVFHRVIPHFIIQGGDPKSKSSAVNRDTYGLGGPGYTLPPEIALKHDRGAVAMARLPDELNPKRESNGSQFYICLAPCPSLDDQYTVFGHVIEGMEVADAIADQARDKRDNPIKRIEMTVSLQPREQAAVDGSAANP
jgi:peptidylprolyl isomerase/peptidyl-prolyl cis-trans isomerase B (cyclophilin B)